MTAEQYLDFAEKAHREAAEYRELAQTATEYWRDRHLRSAVGRDEHAEFYENCAAQILQKDAA